MEIEADFRIFSRGISIIDFLVSLALGVLLVGVTVLISPIWKWEFVEPKCPSFVINGTTNSVGMSSTSETPPTSFSLFSEAKSDKDLMILWLFYMLIVMITLIRTSAAFALYKATALGKNPKKALKHCIYWTVVNVVCMVFGGYMVYQMYGGTFAKVNFLSTFEYWMYWLSLTYQIAAVVCVLLFIFRDILV